MHSSQLPSHHLLHSRKKCLFLILGSLSRPYLPTWVWGCLATLVITMSQLTMLSILGPPPQENTTSHLFHIALWRGNATCWITGTRTHSPTKATRISVCVFHLLAYFESLLISFHNGTRMVYVARSSRA